ncbi:outer membrane protein [Roseovarius halotolerans]|uniref:Outer membrane protein W n=1 Tax=Roseovarius halotolerans TaxID=505353 RepID=A0A1X6Z9H2_9RHOB|nr:OmpW family outer membrane protein [Roseovarius halotolerans]RKT30431.1 outer membrane protein [Roseovarius halotolerans]SLN44336.1 Outer membrane protein W precursor [Roseovarius halotolerans]
MKTLTALTLATALAGAAAPALAQEKGSMTLGIGVAGVLPDGSSNTAAGSISVGDNVRPTLTFEYFLADNIGVEVLAAWPFEHDIKLAGVGTVGKTKHLPPTISVQYHFTNKSSLTPFVGIGINYTTFWDDKGTGVLAGVPIGLDDSWGLALHAGVDYALSEKSALRADVRWINIETDATVGGAPIGKVKIDPWVVGMSYVMKF